MRTAQGEFIALAGIIAVVTFQPARMYGVTIRDDTPDADYLALANSPPLRDGRTRSS